MSGRGFGADQTVKEGSSSERSTIRSRTTMRRQTVSGKRLDSLGLLAQLLDRVVGRPLVVEGDEVVGHVSSLAGVVAPCGHRPPSPRTAAARSNTASGFSGGRDRPPGGPGEDVQVGGDAPIRCRGDGQGDRADLRWPKPDFASAVGHADSLTGGSDRWSDQARSLRGHSTLYAHVMPPSLSCQRTLCRA